MFCHLTHANTQSIILITVTFKIIFISSLPCFEHFVISNFVIIINNIIMKNIFMYKFFKKGLFPSER